MAVEMKVADERHVDAHAVERIADVRHRRRGFGVVYRHAHDFGAGARERGHLLHRAVDVGGVGVGHRLHDDRRVAADLDMRNAHRACSRAAAPGRIRVRQLIGVSGARRSRRYAGEDPPACRRSSAARRAHCRRRASTAACRSRALRLPARFSFEKITLSLRSRISTHDSCSKRKCSSRSPGLAAFAARCRRGCRPD